MVAYHKGKKKISDLDAPRIRIEAPILPVLWTKLLQLPDGVQFEILDLPGLKWVNDRQSLKVIQEQVKNTFSLVVLDYLQTDDSSRAALLTKLHQGLKDLDPAIEEVRMDLFYNIIYPVREAFKDGLKDIDLAYKLRNSLSPIDLRRVIQSYGSYSQGFMTPDAAADGLKFEARQGDEEEEERLKKASQSCRRLYQRMKEALSNRAEFILQKKSRRFEKAVASILRDEANKIAAILDKHLKERKMFLPDFGSMIQTSDIRIPDTLFELPGLQKEVEDRVEIVGEKTETRIEETSCLKRKREKTCTRIIRGAVSYDLLELPGAEEMAEQWAKGITLAQSDLWGKMAEWIRNAFESALDQYSDAVIRFQHFFEEECDKQVRFIEQTGQTEMKKWNQVLEELKEARTACEELRAYSITKENGDSHE